MFKPDRCSGLVRLLLASTVSLLVSCQSIEQDEDAIALVRFDRTMLADHSVAPLAVSAGPQHTFVNGKIGSAIALRGNDRIVLSGAALDQVSPQQGSLACWVNQQWSGNEPGIREIFSIEFDTGFIKMHWAEGHLNVNSAFDGKYHHAFYHQAGQWQANEWHHVAISWSYADGYTAVDLYVDQKHVTGFLGALAMGTPKRIVIGGPFKKRPYPDAPVIYDEVRLSTRVPGGSQADEIDVGPSTARRLGATDTNDIVIWTESASRKVYPNQAVPSTNNRTPHVALYAAANEYEPVQLVITPKKDIANVSVEVSDLIGPSVIEKRHLSVSHVQQVQVDFPSGRFGKRGLHPDPLPPVGLLNLQTNRHTTLWLTVHTPPDTKPGRYRGTIKLIGDRFAQNIPVELTVWNFALPARPTMDTLCLIRPQYLREEAFESVYKNVANHRMTGIVGTRLAQKMRNAKSFNQPSVNQELDLLTNQLGFKYVAVPIVGWISHRGTHRWPDGLKWRGQHLYFADETNAVLSPEFKHEFEPALRQLVAYLEQQGALDRAMLWYQDEMSWDHAPTLRKSVAMARFIKSIEPRIKIVQSKYPHPDLLPYTDIWCVHSDHYDVHTKAIDNARRNGAQVWIYNNGIPIIDYPAMRNRMFPWMLWKRGISGSFSYWSVNEWQHPTWDAKHERLAGSGLLLYPARKGTNDPTPINSIRWELLREGLEDVEYLHLLSERVTTAKAKGRNVSNAERLLDQARQLVQGLPRVSGLPDQPHTLDVAKLEKIRHRIATEIERLDPGK